MDYPYIRAWGHLMGSFAYYVERQVTKARDENAPKTAIYRGYHAWHTVGEIQSPATRRSVEYRAHRLAPDSVPHPDDNPLLNPSVVSTVSGEVDMGDVIDEMWPQMTDEEIRETKGDMDYHARKDDPEMYD